MARDRKRDASWYSRASSKEAKDEVDAMLVSAAPAFARLREMAGNRLVTLEQAGLDFHESAWFHKLAHREGAKEELRWLLNLLR